MSSVIVGSSLEFHYFMAAFDEAVEKKMLIRRGKLTRLIKYTTGEVKEIVKNYIQRSPKEGYETANQLMHKLYGDPHRVIAAYRKEIKQWPQIKPGDAGAYRKFHNFLFKCENITQMQTWSVLDTPEIMCILLSKRPGGCWLIHNEYRTSIRLHNCITSSVKFDRENEIAK